MIKKMTSSTESVLGSLVSKNDENEVSARSR